MGSTPLSRRTLLWLFGPAILIYVTVFMSPLSMVIAESFRQYVPGSIGSSRDAPATIANYQALFQPAYLGYFLDTIRISFISTIVALIFSYPTAHILARTNSKRLRVGGLSVLLGMLFVSVLVKVYSIALIMGPVGFGGTLSRLLGSYPTSRFMNEISVVVGLVSFVYPIATLTLMNAIQNVNPNYVTAAVSLGASWTKAYLAVELPLCRQAILSVGITCFTLGVSAFVIPLILGKGQVSFVTNLIYTRFSEVANYPSGAALATSLLIGVLLVFVVAKASSMILSRRGARA